MTSCTELLDSAREIILRGRQVPEDAMLRLAERLTPPELEEGFSRITIVHADGAAEPKFPR